MRRLDHRLARAPRCRIPALVKLAAAITDHRAAIDAARTNEPSSARAESDTTKPRLLTRIAFGCRAVDTLIGLAILSLGDCRPPLPGRK